MCPSVSIDQDGSHEDDDIFWIDQKMISPIYQLNQVSMEDYLTSCIVDVLTDDQFVKLYCQ